MSGKRSYAHVRSRWLQMLVDHQPGALASHWVFQGMLIMDPSERRFKLMLDGVLALLLTPVLLTRYTRLVSAFVAIMIAHTLNFLLNAHIFGVLKSFGGIINSRHGYDREVERLRARIANEPSIRFAAAYGSLARGEWSPSSDLDVRLIRGPGVKSAVRACWFAMYERARALWIRFPLDIFVLDDYRSLTRMSETEPLILGGSEVEPSTTCDHAARQ